MVRVFFGVPGSYGNTGEEVYGHYWALGERERQAPPPRPSPNWTRGRGCAPSFLLFPLPLPCWIRSGGGKRRERGRKGGRRPPLLVLFGLGGRGARPCPGRLSSLFPLKPNKAHILLLPYSRNSPVLRKITEPLGTFLMSEYSRPIYRSLCLDHFETPRHVPDLIQDSELLRYIKTHKLII